MPRGVYQHKKGYKIKDASKYTGVNGFKKGQIPWNKELKGFGKEFGFQKGHPLYSNSLKIWKENGGIVWNKGKNMLSYPQCGFQKGEKHINWNNGSSFEPYGLEFNEDLKEVIRNRDRRKCFICEKTELDNGEKLKVHHIDYCKQNNDPQNLISLCKNCHSKTNHNREHWENILTLDKHSSCYIINKTK